MIRIVLKGGLGNQMFQYALGKTLSLIHETELYLDLSFLEFKPPLISLTPLRDFTFRDFALDIFEITDLRGSLFSSEFAKKYFSYPSTFLYHRYIKKNYLKQSPNPYIFDPKILTSGPDVALEGYWNNYKYFERFEGEVRKIFDPDKLYNKKYQNIETEIKERKNSVSIHLRRGDYLNKKHQNVYVELSSFYINAVKYIKSNLDRPFFYIFSEDNPEWLESVVKLDKSEYKIIDSVFAGQKNKTHFRLMTLCKNNVISNSTYSWWAAYLNKNSDKIVITPKNWMQKFSFENIPSWVVLENK